MTLLVREVARFLLESAVWLAAAIAIAAVIGWLSARWFHSDLGHTIAWCVIGAITAAAAADRIGLPATAAPSVGSRPLPILWLAIGALGTAAIIWRTNQTPDAASGLGR
jgi:hypothetical protein